MEYIALVLCILTLPTMRIAITYLLSLISSLTFGLSNRPITDSKLLVIDTNVVFKHFEDVQVLQFFDNDSTNGEITLSKKIDANGNVLAEYYKGYKTDKGNGRADVLTIDEYDKENRLRVSTDYYGSFKINSVEKTFYYYEDSLLVRLESFELRKRIKADVDKGYGRPGGCIITAEDYEKDMTWELSRIFLHRYDKFGRKIVSYSPVFRGSHNRYEYEYSNDGKLWLEKSLDKSRLLYTEYYKYKDNQIISVLIWDKKDWSGTKRIKYFDKNGNIIKETTIQKDKEWVDKYEYDPDGRLIRFKAYDSEGKINLTHIYNYKK